MSNRVSLWSGLSAALLALLLAGCTNNDTSNQTSSTSPQGGNQTPQGGSSGGKYKVITNGISPFWEAMGKGLDAGKKALNVEADWQGPNPAEHNAQVKLVKDAVAAKVDGIAVSAIEADALAATIDEAVAAGIPVITFDSDSPNSKRAAYIGTVNKEAGRIAGEEAAKLFPNGGKLVAFVGNMTAQNAKERYEGFLEGVKGKNITFLQEPFEDNKDKSRARQNVADAITKYQGQVTGFVGFYSYNGPAIVSAVEQAGLMGKVKIVCFDGEPETIRNLEAGKVDVTVVQKPYEFGRLSVMLLNEMKKNGGKSDAALQAMKTELDKLGMKLDGTSIDTGVTVVTPANAKQFLEELKAKGLEST
jgi:ribose transport system substrate-binding protein